MAFTVTQIPNIIQYTKNEMTVSIHGDVENALFRLDVLRENNTVITSLEGRLDEYFNLSWDLSEILDAMAQHSTYGIGSFQHDQKVRFLYRFNIIEVNSIYAIAGMYTSPLLRAIKGGIAQGFITDPFARIKNGSHFLSYSEIMTVLPDQLVVLDFLYLNPSIITLTAKAKLFYTDGTNYTVVLGNWEDWEPYNLIRVNAGFKDNLLNTPFPEKTVSHYIVTISDALHLLPKASIIISLDYQYYRNPVIFLFANSLGGIETAYLSGNDQFTFKPEIQSAERHSIAGKKIISFNHSITRETETSTGYKSKVDIERLAEIFLTPFVYQYANGSLIPIIINQDSSLVIDNFSNLNAATIKYSRSFVNRSYTPDLYDVKN